MFFLPYRCPRFLTVCGFYLISFKFGQEWHYDAVVPLGHGQRLAAEEQEKAKKKEKKEKKDKDKKEKKEKTGNMGYNLSGRRPGEGYLKHKYAAEETDGEIKDYFIKTVMSSQAQGSNRRRVCGQSTANMHWYAMRQYVGWLQKGNHLENYPDGVSPITLLGDPDLLTLYFNHMEQEMGFQKESLKTMRCKSGIFYFYLIILQLGVKGDSFYFHLIILQFGMLQAHGCRT